MLLNNITKNALLIVLCLAEAGGKMTKAEICEASGALPNYFSATMRELVKANVVHSIKGQEGGYIFVGDPDVLTLYDLLSLYQHPFDVGVCLVGNHRCTEQDMSECLCKQVVARAMNAMDEELKKVTLRDFLEIKQLAVIKHHNEKYGK